MSKHIEVIKLLIESGADVNSCDSKGRTCLHFAAANNDLTVAQLLINFGANVNCSDKNGKTPLSYAEGGKDLLYERILPKNTKELFESLATTTWERLEDSEKLGCLQGEETITDINVLEIKRAGFPNISVNTIPKTEEAKKGFDIDLGVWIGSNSGHWQHFLIQAKRLDTSNLKYNKLRHKIKEQFQFEKLEDHAKTMPNTTAFYCFYNFVKLDNLNNFWRCCEPFEEHQLGCTIAPLDSIRNAFSPTGSKTFQWIHSQNQTIPWRCLFCPKNPLNLNTTFWPRLPFSLKGDTSEIDFSVQNEPNPYKIAGFYPRFIIIIQSPNP